MQIKGIIFFPQVFTPKAPKGSTTERYGCGLLLSPSDPNTAILLAAVKTTLNNKFPSGAPRGHTLCANPYDEAFDGATYYDKRFSGWTVLNANAKLESKPAVVYAENGQPVLDPSEVYSGAIAWLSFDLFAFDKGKGGVAAGLKVVALTDEVSEFGRLDGRPSKEQEIENLMRGISVAATKSFTPPPAPPVVKTAPVMTEKAAGASYEAFIANGWTHEMLVSQGYVK